TMPALYMILILQCVMAPITSSVAFAALLGLDVALALVTLIACSALAPLTTVGLSYLFLGTSLISPLELGIKLFLLFAVSAALALVLRRIFGQRRIEAHKEAIDGLTVIATFVFAIAAMSGVTEHVIKAPLLSLGVFALCVAVSLMFIAVTALVFIRAGRERALGLGLLAGFRNIGVLMAALGPSVPELAWFYFAVSQFPIYLLPALLKPLSKRFQQNTGAQIKEL
ncbi:MAG: Na+-dependent transporter, partial [Pseudolabrys sp.]|nr:Na+-dependent transporter [Pseudolabrys sp.]